MTAFLLCAPMRSPVCLTALSSSRICIYRVCPFIPLRSTVNSETCTKIHRYLADLDLALPEQALNLTYSLPENEDDNAPCYCLRVWPSWRRVQVGRRREPGGGRARRSACAPAGEERYTALHRGGRCGPSGAAAHRRVGRRAAGGGPDSALSPLGPLGGYKRGVRGCVACGGGTAAA